MIRVDVDEAIKVLENGRRVDVPVGSTRIRWFMSTISILTKKELLLFRSKDGKRYLTLGNASSVKAPPDAMRLIAHTHPRTNSLILSAGDRETLHEKNQRLHVVIAPHRNEAKLLSAF